MRKSAITAENSLETSSMNVSCPAGNKVNAERTDTDEVLALIRCVLRHLHKQSTELKSAAEQLLPSLHLFLQSTSITDDINKGAKGPHTEEQLGSFPKEENSEKQSLVAYLHSILKDCSHPVESHKKSKYSPNQCIIRVTCFRKALEWLYENTQGNLEPDLLMNLKITINGLERTIKHLDSLQDEKGDDFCSANDAVQFQLDLHSSLFSTQNLKPNSSSKESDSSQEVNINMVSAENEKSSVSETGPHSFLAKLYASWNSESRISPNSEKSTTSNQCVPGNVIDHHSVEPKPLESFSSHMLSAEDYNLMISSDTSTSSLDETDRLIISTLPENSESLISSKEGANVSDTLSIKASTSDGTNKLLAEETNSVLLPPESSSKAETAEHSVQNTVGSIINCISVNATLSQEEGVKHSDLVPRCTNTQTEAAQMACEHASINTPANTAGETTLSSLSQLPCKNQSSKRTPRKHNKWRVCVPPGEINEKINPQPEVRQTRSQAMKKANESLKIIIHKVPDIEDSNSTEDLCSPRTEKTPRKRRRKSSKVKVSQNSDSTDKEPSSLPSVQQAPLISHLWKKHKATHKNTSQDCDKAPTINLNESSVMNVQPESHPPDTSTNNTCQEKTVHINKLESPLDLSPKQNLEMSSGISQSSVRSSIVDNSVEKEKEMLKATVGNRNQNESYASSITSVSPLAPPPVMRAEISSNQCTQPNISVQNALVKYNLPSENIILPQPIINGYNTNMPYEGGFPQITPAERQLPSQRINSPLEGRTLQINEDPNAVSSVNQRYCLQPFKTTVTSFGELANRNGINDQSNNLRLAPYYGTQQLPHLQQGVAVPRSDETAYNCRVFNSVHALPSNMNMSQSDIQGRSHFGPLAHCPTLAESFNGIQISNNQQGLSTFRRRMGPSNVQQRAPKLGEMVDYALSNRMLFPSYSALSLYGAQRPCGSRAPAVMGPSEAEQTPLADGALVPRHSAPQLYERHNLCPSRMPDMRDSSRAEHTPNIMGTVLATATMNATQTPGNEVLPPCGRYIHQMGVSNVHQAPANMYARQGPNHAIITSRNNERQIPENAYHTPQVNRRQRQPARTTPLTGRRCQRVAGATNIGQENNELIEPQTVIPNAERISVNVAAIKMGNRDGHPAQPSNHISAEQTIAHAPYNYFGGNTGEQSQALQRSLSRRQISPLPNVSQMHWYSVPQPAWNNQGQIGFLQPSAAGFLYNDQRNQSSQNLRSQQARN